MLFVMLTYIGADQRGTVKADIMNPINEIRPTTLGFIRSIGAVLPEVTHLVLTDAASVRQTHELGVGVTVGLARADRGTDRGPTGTLRGRWGW